MHISLFYHGFLQRQNKSSVPHGSCIFFSFCFFIFSPISQGNWRQTGIHPAYLDSLNKDMNGFAFVRLIRVCPQTPRQFSDYDARRIIRKKVLTRCHWDTVERVNCVTMSHWYSLTAGVGCNVMAVMWILMCCNDMLLRATRVLMFSVWLAGWQRIGCTWARRLHL